MERQDLIQEYLKLLELKKQYWHLEGEDEKERFRRDILFKVKTMRTLSLIMLGLEIALEAMIVGKLYAQRIWGKLK